MKRNFNAIATSALIKKSRKLYKAKLITRLEHIQNMNYILQKMDAIFIEKQQCDLIIDVIRINGDTNDINSLMDKLILSVN